MKMTILHKIYKHSYDEEIEEALDWDDDGELINHTDYLDYTYDNVESILFRDYEEAFTFFKNTYSKLLELEHWMDLNDDEDSTISFVSWNRSIKFNEDITVIFYKEDEHL